VTIDDLMLHADTLYRFALGRVGDHHAAEDLVQDCLSAAWQKRESFDGRSQLSTWLIGIMKFKVIDHFRRAKRTPTDQAVDPFEEGRDPLDSVFDGHGSWRIDPNHGMATLESAPDEASRRSDIATWLRACMEQLPERLRLLFTLREADGLAVPAAAAAAGVTPGSAAVLLTRSRQNLRLCLQRHGIQP
jgi:RNA polymerase sigma-70 factor (ECF subfamily)